MSQGFRNDDERLEAIKRSQERMRGPEGIDLDKIMDRVVEENKIYWIERELSYGFVRVILNKAHETDKWRTRIRMEWSLKNLEAKIIHIRVCAKCQQVVEYATRALEYVKIVPRVVTREDAEKAIEYLAKNNNMTKAEFREWMKKTGDEIIREMNEDNKT